VRADVGGAAAGRRRNALKVLEAMAAELRWFSTTLGAEGLAVTPGKDIVIADTPEAMADAVRWLAG